MKNAKKINAKHTNQVRIIGGKWRNSKLQFADASGLRPTPEMVREKLFNWLGQDLTGQTVLDLFSGSGALGLEAASRGAKRVFLCENNRITARYLKKYIQQFQCVENIFLQTQNGLNFLANTTEKFDVVFLDPPFSWQNWTQLFDLLRNILNNDAFVYVEAGKLPAHPDWLTIYREGRAGQSHFFLLQFVSK